MTTLLDEHFDAGANNAVLTTGNTGFSSITGSPVFTTDSISGLAMKVLTSADNQYGSFGFSQKAVLYLRFYIKLVGTTAQAYLFNVPGSLVNMRVNANGSLRARNGTLAVGSDSTALVTSTGFTRVECRIDFTAGEQQFKMFTGANLHGSTPNYDSGNLALTTAAGVTSIGVGSTLGAVTGASYIIDDFAISDSGWLGSSQTPPANAAPNAIIAQGATSIPTFRTSASAQINAGSVAVTIPSTAQPGDVALAWSTIGLANATMVAPSGWTQVGTTKTTSSQTSAMWSKVLTATDINKQLSFSGGVGKQAVSVVVYSNVNTSNPIGDAQVTTRTTSSSTASSPAMTAIGRLIEAAISKATDPGVWTPPSGFTLRTSINQSGTGSMTIGIAGSETDLVGPNTWTLVAPTTQATVWGVWLTPLVAGVGDIEPFSTVTLDGSGSNDADGTIVSYNWSQTSGPAVTLSGSGPNRTFEAPGTIDGATLVFSLTVTDDDGATSAPASVSVTVLPVTERMAVGGVLVPLKIVSAQLAP